MNARSLHWIKNAQERSVRSIMRAFLALAVVLLVGCGGKKFVAPPLAEVKSIELQLFEPPNNPILPVASSLHERVLKMLNGAILDVPAKWIIRGRLSITTVSGTINLALFHTGEDRGAFGFGDEQYRGSSDAEITGLIEAAMKLQSGPTAGGQAPTAVPEK